MSLARLSEPLRLMIEQPHYQDCWKLRLQLMN
jgi:hypothetical protein